MAARVFNFAVERPVRRLNKALARAEALVGEAQDEQAMLRDELDGLQIDPRAAVFLNILRAEFARYPATLREIEHLGWLLKGSNRR